jgi:hypothetical protein
MKKWIVLIMDSTFTLGITSLVFAAEEKKPADPPATLSVEEKTQLERAKKPSTEDKMKEKKAAETPAAPEKK